jgi:hypothetical protein
MGGNGAMPTDGYDPKMSAARLKVNQLLNEASDLKMLRYHTREARRKIETAYRLAEKNHLPKPWPALCAYRLGHLIMRTASDMESLFDADGYFIEAARSKSLGPLPAIYRLSVLHRLKKAGADVGEALIKRAIEKAQDDIQGFEFFERTQIQDHLFNLLELAAYFTAVDYPEVEGMGEYHNPEKPPHFWILVGPDPRIAEVKYSEAFALEELDALTKSHSDAVFFVLRNLNSPETGDRPKAQWKIDQQKWKKASYPKLKLLALLLRQTSHTLDGLMQAFLGERYHTLNAFNQTKLRLKRHLAELTGMEMEEIFLESAQRIPRINPHIGIFGAVEESALFI